MENVKYYYKAFDKNFQCRGFQYEVGKAYSHDGDVVPCKSGFHACANPLGVFEFYSVADFNRYALVELDGIVPDGSKVAARTITIVRELSLLDLICASVELNSTARPRRRATTARRRRRATTARRNVDQRDSLLWPESMEKSKPMTALL